MSIVRIALRLAVLLCVAAAAISLVALSAEYPGQSAANRRVLGRDPLSLTLLAWAHLGVLEGERGGSSGLWALAALAGDFVLFIRSAAAARHGAAPLTLALPGIAALLLVCTLGVVWRTHRTRVGA